MIVITVTGNERLDRISGTLYSVKDASLTIALSELLGFAESLHSDSEIPKEYRDSLLVFGNRRAGEAVLIAYAEQYKLFGRYVEYQGYRCPIEKYWGGKVAPQYSGRDYIKEKWKREKSKILSNMNSRIGEYVRSIVSGLT